MLLLRPWASVQSESTESKCRRMVKSSLWLLPLALSLLNSNSGCQAFVLPRYSTKIQTQSLASWSGANGNYLDALNGNSGHSNSNNGYGNVQVQTQPVAQVTAGNTDATLSFDEWYRQYYCGGSNPTNSFVGAGLEETAELIQQLEQAVPVPSQEPVLWQPPTAETAPPVTNNQSTEDWISYQHQLLQQQQGGTVEAPETQTTYRPSPPPPQQTLQPNTAPASFSSAYDTQYAAAMATVSSPPAAATSATQDMAMRGAQQDFNTGGSTAGMPETNAQTEQETPVNEDRYLKMVSTEVGVKLLNGQNPYAITDIPLSVMIQRFLDNVEDSTQKNNGKVKGVSRLKGKSEPAPDRPSVIVLGSGWAAHAFIKLASTYDLRIVVVSPVNHFVFTPMLASAAVGTVEYRSMTEPIRVTNPFIDNYVEGRAIGIDVPNKLLTVQLTPLATVTGVFKGLAAQAPCRLEPEPEISDDSESSDASRVIDLSYDYLVCAVGTSVRSDIVPGAKEHCFNLKTSQDSKRLRTAIGESLEYASRPDVQESYYSDRTLQLLARDERKRRVRFVLVGGGPTGVELAGELMDFFSQVCRKPDGAFQHLAEDISVILVHGGDEILPAMDKPLRQRALAALQAQGVELRLNTRLKQVGRDFVRLQEKGCDVVDCIAVGLTCWCAGNAPVSFVKELLSKLPESAAGSAGRVNVDGWLRCPTPTPESFGSILVLGDAACLEAQSKHFPATSLPQTAQVAGQQGAYAARMLNRGYDLQQTLPRLPEEVDEFSLLRVWLLARGLNEAPQFNFLSLGLMAYIGGGEALNQVQLGDVPIFNYAGRVAFFLWQTVYLSKQAATRNQALIAFDWLRTGAFGRDITRL